MTNIFFLLITSPKDAMYLAFYKKRVAFFIFLFSAFSVSVGFSLINPYFSFKSSLIFCLSFMLAWLFICSSCLFISCEIIQGGGDIKRLFLSFSISLFPLIFITPFAILSKVTTLFLFGFPFVFLWVFYLQFIFVRKLYLISHLKTLLAFSLPLVFFFLVLIFITMGFIEAFLKKFF